MLNFMCRMTFAAIAAATALSPLKAQQVPGRDLFLFPLGSMAEAPALASVAGGGFWNPATIALSKGDRYLFSADALHTPIDQGISAQLGTVAVRLRERFTLGASIAQSGVGDLIRTDTDPQSFGDEIPYSSTIYSAVAAARAGSTTVGLAYRYRSGRVDLARGWVGSFDVGATVDRPRGLPFRAAVSSFLLSPSRRAERASGVAALEGYLPVSGEHDVRTGVSYQLNEGGGDERYVYASGRIGILDLRGGVARQQDFGFPTTRLRVGMGLRYQTYVVGIAREDGTAGLGATYQFLLSTIIPERKSP